MTETRQTVRRVVTVPETMAGLRLDQAASRLFDEFSRARLQQWIRSGSLRLDGETAAPKAKVAAGSELALDAELEEEPGWRAQPIALDVVYEDDTVVVINKPPGLVVHPAAGHREGTLLNALLHRHPKLAAVPRAGIVHRLDKDTSGLLVVARTLQAQTALVRQLQQRTVSREYLAVVPGRLIAGGTIDGAIGRHPVHRQRMAVTRTGKPAVSHYTVVERFRGHTLIRVRLETGRTHQIRVHMAHIGHPLVGDPAYSGRMRIPGGIGDTLRAELAAFPRQALHAARLAFEHPETGDTVSFEAPLPDDFAALLAALRADAAPIEPDDELARS